MKSFIYGMLTKAQKFNLLDFAFFKTTLIFLGILLGAYFSDFFRENIIIVWLIFLVSYGYIIYSLYIR